MNISPIPQSAIDAVRKLLATAKLPFDDISDSTELFTLTKDGKTIGSIGLEHDGKVGLLRSLSVAEESRSGGYGGQLVDHLEKMAKEKGITALYLLTTTAAPFFAKRGYAIIDRAEAPAFIQQTSEFKSTCPSSATAMKKDL